MEKKREVIIRKVLVVNVLMIIMGTVNYGGKSSSHTSLAFLYLLLMIACFLFLLNYPLIFLGFFYKHKKMTIGKYVEMR